MNRLSLPILLGVLLASVIMAVVMIAAPIPMPPVEGTKTYKDAAEYNLDTLDIMGSATKIEDTPRGYRIVTKKGFYWTYTMPNGWMVISNVSDGRLKYGYFDFDTGASIEYNGKKAPEACMPCHNNKQPKGNP